MLRTVRVTAEDSALVGTLHTPHALRSEILSLNWAPSGRQQQFMQYKTTQGTNNSQNWLLHKVTQLQRDYSRGTEDAQITLCSILLQASVLTFQKIRVRCRFSLRKEAVPTTRETSGGCTVPNCPMLPCPPTTFHLQMSIRSLLSGYHLKLRWCATQHQ